MHKYHIGTKENSNSNTRIPKPCVFLNNLNQRALTLREEAGNKPIWLKEFSVMLDNEDEYNSLTYNDIQTQNFMLTIIKHFNQSNIFTRFAWFNTNISPENVSNLQNVNNPDTLTVRSKKHYFSLLYDAYDQQFTNLGNYYGSLNTSNLNTAFSSIISCCDFVEGSSTSWPYVLIATTISNNLRAIIPKLDP